MAGPLLTILFAPIALFVVGWSVWKAFRARRPVFLLAAAVALALEALFGWMASVQVGYGRPVHVERSEAAGRHVRFGTGSRDEVVIDADGTFTRTASYRGVVQTQRGRWSYSSSRERRQGRPSSFPDHATLDFDDLAPACLRSTEPPGTTSHLGEPNEVLCGGGTAPFCVLHDQVGLCLGDEGHEYVKLREEARSAPRWPTPHLVAPARRR